MIPRSIADVLLFNLSNFPATALLGPRQVGKTTLVKTLQPVMPKPSVYLDMENPADRSRLADRGIFFETNRDTTIILDEVQKLPDLFQELRGVIDRERIPGRLLLLGSASYDLLQNTAQSLAGRIAYLELTPFLLKELPASEWQQHWLKGGFPGSYLAPNEPVRQAWLTNFITTYLEKDLPQLGLRAAPAMLERLILMLSYSQGGLANYQELAKSLGVTSPTLTNYVDFLERALLLRRLRPYHTNIGKRLVKSHKIYVRDSGIVHHLLRIPDINSLLGHPVIGGSWEGYVLEQVIGLLAPYEQMFFYRTADGAELDIVIEVALKVKLAIEIKFSSQPTMSKGNTVALQDLGNPPLLIVTPLTDDFKLRDDVWVCSIQTLSKNLETVMGRQSN